MTCQFYKSVSVWSEQSATATDTTGSLKTDSSVLEVVRVVREVRGGGMASDMML